MQNIWKYKKLFMIIDIPHVYTQGEGRLQEKGSQMNRVDEFNVQAKCEACLRVPK